MAVNVHRMVVHSRVYVWMAMWEHTVRPQVEFFAIVLDWSLIQMMYMIVPCALRPCENGGTCQLLSTNMYGCACPPEYTGSQCETPTICKMTDSADWWWIVCWFSHSYLCDGSNNCLRAWWMYVEWQWLRVSMCNGVDRKKLWHGILYVIVFYRMCRKKYERGCLSDYLFQRETYVIQTHVYTEFALKLQLEILLFLIVLVTVDGLANCVMWTSVVDIENFRHVSSHKRNRLICVVGGCVAGYCLSGGTCLVSGNVPYCQCPPLYTGLRCETLVSSLTTTPAPSRKIS